MYTVDSIADISANKSLNKKAVQVKEIKYQKPVVKVNAKKKKLNFETRVEMKNGKQIVRKPQQKPKPTMNEKPKPSGNKIMKNKKIKNAKKMLGPVRIPEKIPEPTVNEILNDKKINNANKRVTLKRKNSDIPHIKLKKPKLAKDDHRDRTIFVGNVPLDTKQKELKQFLSSYGPIESVRFQTAPIEDLKIPRKVAVQQGKFHPKRKSMNAYVVFESPEDAIKAKNANGTEFKNFHLRIDSLRVQRIQSSNKTSIFIGNVPYDAEEEDVRKVFQDCGAIDNIRLIRDRTTNIGKGIGFVNFHSTDAVHLALQLEDVRIGNRKIKVDMSNYNSQEVTNKKVTPEGKKKQERFAIHISNVPEKMTGTDIKNLFKSCGAILSVRIAKGKESRFCFVNFKDAESVQNALKLGAPGTQLIIKECKPKVETKKIIYPAIYIRNIPIHTQKDQLLKLFDNCGKIVSAKLFNNIIRKTAVGFINFEEDEAVKLALTKTFNIGNNQLEVSRKVEKTRGEAPKIKKQEVIDSDSDSDDHNDDENIRNVSLADSDEPSEDEDNAEDLDAEEVDDEDDEDYEDAEETEELNEEEEDSNDEVDNESDDE